MRRSLLAVLLLAALAVVLVARIADDDGDGYVVRAYFDNAGFLVPGEDVRIAGGTVGSVESVEVALPGEAVTADGGEDPGKAVVVMRIDDAGFQDFRTDASCLIRPQSLLGEKYVECDPTRPRAPGSPAPPELERIPDGDIGAGEHRLPLENTGKSVDLDLVNNISRQPEIDRFRLILNDLGAGLAARGADLEEVIRRANPALQETDKVLRQLARQNRQLARLAADSDRILGPLARERTHLAGFIRNTATAGEAAAERRDDIAAGFRELPPALRELRRTMAELRGFAEEGIPVAANLQRAAPGLTGATRALRPFSQAGTTALLSLGDAAEASGPDLAASSPVIRQLRKLGKTSLPGSRNLRAVLSTLRRTGGIDFLMKALLNNSNVFNGFDEFGHYLRAQIQITNCVDYVVVRLTGCSANWTGSSSAAAPAGAPAPTAATIAGEGLPGFADAGGSGAASAADAPSAGLDAAPDGAPGAAAGEGAGAGAATRASRDLLGFLIGGDR